MYTCYFKQTLHNHQYIRGDNRGMHTIFTLILLYKTQNGIRDQNLSNYSSGKENKRKSIRILHTKLHYLIVFKEFLANNQSKKMSQLHLKQPTNRLIICDYYKTNKSKPNNMK